MPSLRRSIVPGVVLAGLLASSSTLAQGGPPAFQPIIDMHRHAPWPGESDADGLALIRDELARHQVVAAMLFITGREDVEAFQGDQRARLILSPMFPCPALTDTRKWCFPEAEGMLPDPTWVENQIAAGALGGLGELAFSYAAVSPLDPAMAPYWAMAARHDIPAFVHTGRGPPPGEGPRRHPNCCTAYDAELGNPELLRPILARHPALRISLQHVGFEFVDETIALLRDFPNVYLDMSVLNSVGPAALHDASLRRIVDAGFADRIMLGSDDQDLAIVLSRIEDADFLTADQKRAIYYDNAARFLRFDRATIDRDYRR